MSEPVLEVSGVSKAYRIWQNPASRLTVPLIAGAARALPSRPGRWLTRRTEAAYRDHWALREISFTVAPGESIGVIGRNGSGKSTLLQIVAGTTQPTTGEVKSRGRIAALLELGSGFNPEFSGRENVLLNGAVLGLSRSEVEARFDDIAAFADIGEFIEQPVKTYSTGMMVRLAFAVAVSVQPDLLIVDEALSVGDVFFQQKCFRRVHEMLEAGVSLLFVSHDTAAVQNLCDRALFLANGELKFEGPPEEAASRYYASSSRLEQPAVSASAQVAPPAAALRAEVVADDILPRARSRQGAHELEIVAARAIDEQGRPTLSVPMTQRLSFQILLRAHRAIASPNVGLHLFDRMNNLVFAAGTRQLGVVLRAFAAGEERVITLALTANIQPGAYTFSLGCSEPSADGPNQGFVQDRHEGLGPLEVLPPTTDVWPFYGIARLPMEVTGNS